MKKTTLLLSLIFAFGIIYGQNKKQASVSNNKTIIAQQSVEINSCETFIFKSGFEDSTTEILDFTNQRIYDLEGTDTSTNLDWETDLEADGRNFSMNYVDHSGGQNPEMLGARIVTDPDNPDNKVFYTYQNDAEYQDGGFWSRVQGELSNFHWLEVYYKVYFKLDSAIALGDQESANDLSLSIFEINGGPGQNLSRIIMHKWGSNQSFSDGKSPLTWRAEVRTPDEGHVLYESSGIRPKFGEWQLLEFYAKAGDEYTGRFKVAIDNNLIFDKTVKTKDAGYWQSAGFLKVYGGSLVQFLAGKGKVLEVWFDDFEFWATEATPPPPPSDVQAVAASESQIDLSWTDNSDTEDAFRLERKKNDGDYSFINLVGANTVTYSDKGLSAGTAYSYRIKSLDNIYMDSPFSEAATATTFTVSNKTLYSNQSENMIYPNPVEANEMLNICCKLPEAAYTARVSIYSLDGRKTFSKEYSVNQGNNRIISIPLSGVTTKGMYLINLETNSEQLLRERLIVL